MTQANMTDKNLKPGIWCFGGTEKRMKFRKKKLVGPIFDYGHH